MFPLGPEFEILTVHVMLIHSWNLQWIRNYLLSCYTYVINDLIKIWVFFSFGCSSTPTSLESNPVPLFLGAVGDADQFGKAVNTYCWVRSAGSRAISERWQFELSCPSSYVGCDAAAPGNSTLIVYIPATFRTEEVDKGSLLSIVYRFQTNKILDEYDDVMTLSIYTIVVKIVSISGVHNLRDHIRLRFAFPAVKQGLILE